MPTSLLHGRGLALVLVSIACACAGDAARAADAPPAQEGGAYALSPHYKPGQRWSTTFNYVWEVNETIINGQRLPADAVAGVQATGGGWVLAAEEGQYRQVLIQFGKCENTTGTRGQQNPAVTAMPQSNKDFVVVREVSPITDEARVRVVRRQRLTADLDPSFEESLKVALDFELFPKEPVKVGATWTSKSPAAFLGAGHEGTMDMQLVRVIRGEDGREKAIVQVTRAEVTRGMGAGTTGVCQFTGNIRIDLDDRLVDLMEFRGTVSLRTKVQSLQSEQRGPWTYKSTTKLLTAKPPTTQQVKQYAQEPDDK